jgi:D-serine dehydratase
MTLLPRLELATLDAMPLDASTKGLPFGAPPLTIGAIGGQGWSVLAGDLPLPLALVREPVVRANSAWMSAFLAANGLVIAPHGKTTMAPALFDLQVADGAWAITVATVQQLEVCRRFGVRRVLMANQPVGRLAVAACFAALAAGIELYCLVDGSAGLALLAEGASRNPPPAGNPLRILVEMGFVGGRTGARTRAAAIDLARAAAATPGLVLGGFECFEGLLPTADAAQVLVDDVVALSRQAVAESLFGVDQPVILSAGGSAFFDRVGERLGPVELGRPMVRVLRSGCYLTHDSIAYAEAFARIIRETSLPLPPGGLEPALEVWAHVQSRPEDIRAILTMGKRDVGFDAGLPVPLKWYRPGMSAPQTMPSHHVVRALNDQHCHMELPADSPLAIGDMVGFGIGHPCTTFDKWQLLLLVDAEYRVTGGLKTFF